MLFNLILVGNYVFSKGEALVQKILGRSKKCVNETSDHFSVHMISLVCNEHNHQMTELDISNLRFAKPVKILLFKFIKHIFTVNLVLSLGNTAVVMLINLYVTGIEISDFQSGFYGVKHQEEVLSHLCVLKSAYFPEFVSPEHKAGSAAEVFGQMISQQSIVVKGFNPLMITVIADLSVHSVKNHIGKGKITVVFQHKTKLFFNLFRHKFIIVVEERDIVAVSGIYTDVS